MSASVGHSSFPIGKVALANRDRAEIFNFTKAQGRQFAAKNVRFKIALKRLPYGGDARGQLLMSGGVFILIWV